MCGGCPSSGGVKDCQGWACFRRRRWQASRAPAPAASVRRSGQAPPAEEGQEALHALCFASHAASWQHMPACVSEPNARQALTGGGLAGHRHCAVKAGHRHGGGALHVVVEHTLQAEAESTGREILAHSCAHMKACAHVKAAGGQTAALETLGLPAAPPAGTLPQCVAARGAGRSCGSRGSAPAQFWLPAPPRMNRAGAKCAAQLRLT